MTLLRRVSPAVTRQLVSAGVPQQESHDATNDAVGRLFLPNPSTGASAVDRYQGRSTIWRYVYTLAHRAWVDRVRRMAVHERVWREQVHRARSGDGRNYHCPATRVVSREEAEALASGLPQLLLDLPGRERRVITMLFSKGHSIAEVAGALACTGRTVRNLKRRALSRLARFAREHGFASEATARGIAHCLEVFDGAWS